MGSRSRWLLYMRLAAVSALIPHLTTPQIRVHGGSTSIDRKQILPSWPRDRSCGVARRGAGDEVSLGDALGWSQRFARKAVHGRQPARSTFAPRILGTSPRERRPLIALLRLLHSQLGRSLSIRYRSEVVEVYNLVVIQQCRSLPQEPGAGQSLVGAAQGGRCTALRAPCGAPLPRHLILLDR